MAACASPQQQRSAFELGSPAGSRLHGAAGCDARGGAGDAAARSLCDQLGGLGLAPAAGACPASPCTPGPAAPCAGAALRGGAPLASLDLEGVAHLIKSGCARRIVVMAGAGVSVSAGIPDFRTPGTGLYSQLQRYRLPYPEAVFSIDFFRRDPKPFYTLAKELFPGDYAPTPAHFLLRLLADRGLLLRVFTQNIDGLEQLAGVPPERVVAAHGSFDSAHCIDCKRPASMYAVQAAVYDEAICKCDHCGGLVKPDIVFFGEPLPARFHRRRAEDMPQADLLIVMGTSLVVQPFASMIGDVGTDVPRILINRERVGHSPAAKALERSARAAAHASGGGRHHHPAGGASSSSSSSDDEGACKDEHGQGPGRGQQAHVPDEAAAAAAAAAAALEWEAEQEREREREEEGYGSDSGDSVGSDGSGSSSGSGLSGGFDFGLPSNGRDAVHLGDADDAAWRLASLLGWSGELEALIQADAAARAAEAGGREE